MCGPRVRGPHIVLFYTSVGRIVSHARRIVLRVKAGMTGSWFPGAYRNLEDLSLSLE